eukprot:scaffold2347_cov287-Chaetoceros_neogracile.AAC.3
MNEKNGVVGDFDAGTGRRKVIFVAEEGREVWVKPENLKLCVSSPVPIESSKIPILIDVQDRMGSVSLHEVVMRDNVDVASFLLQKHETSIHTEDMDGVGCLPLKCVAAWPEWL